MPDNWQARDGTKRERCDYCPRWSALSATRVMGWCTLHGPKPSLPSVRLLMERAPGDAVTAYSQVCDAFEPLPSPPTDKEPS